MKGLINTIIFKMMPKAETMVKYSDRLVMYDNLDVPLADTINQEVRSVISHLPKKINFVIALLCVTGRFSIKCDLEEFCITDGGLLVLVPGTTVESLNFDPDSKMIVIMVPDDEYAPEASFHNATYARSNFTSSVAVQLDEKTTQSGIETYRQLRSILKENGNKVNKDLVKAYITLMGGLAAVGLHTQIENRKKNKLSAAETVYKDFLKTLSTNFRAHKDVSFYADAAGLSSKYFARQIFNASGKHPLDIIREQVIIDAKSMLSSGEYTISEICDILNFSTQAQFNRYFKGATGMTPGEFQKSVFKADVIHPENA